MSRRSVILLLLTVTIVVAAPTGSAFAISEADDQTVPSIHERTTGLTTPDETGFYATEDTATGFISGRISDAENNDIAAAGIEIINTQTGETAATTTAGSDGSYLVEVEADQEYQVDAEAEGYENGSTTVNVAENTTTTANIILQQKELQSGYISGDIVDTDDNPIPSAEVTVVSIQTGETAATTTAGSDGSYLIEVEADQEYQVDAEAEGYENGSTTVNVAENTTTTADVVLTEADDATEQVEISTDISGPVTPGNEVTVTVTLTNTGSATADAGALEVTVPEEFSVVGVTGDGTNQPDRFYLDSLSPDDSVTTTYTFKTPQNASPGIVGVNVTGSLQFADGSRSASTTANIEVSDGGTADVAVSADTPKTVRPGDEVAATITLTNTGNMTADAAGLEVAIPGELSLIEVAGDGENQPDRFYLTPISPGESVTTTYTFEAPKDASTGTVSFDVTGTLTANDESRSASTTADIEITDTGLPTEPGEPEFIDVLQVIDAYNTGGPYNGVNVQFIDVLEVISAYNAG
ncbi:carboxypeptidase regulatory-like domain-containing protein [Haloplanus rubicundus]|uniref:DUF11 domain-containing protein n=1 Tax=Haloplanus rubicundus TaxID=1547898 RepID=A0A345EBT8_9EURY|nr:carboxypeptidase regulatory-like domain-containing protein [Haloplanus rubicundus]AXG09660.1 DUF11 domain-containing protein [Haloplanus rubicundus]